MEKIVVKMDDRHTVRHHWKKRKKQKKSRRWDWGLLGILIVFGLCILWWWKSTGVQEVWSLFSGFGTGPVVMLDAGHGGKDVGANYDEIYEKDLTLAITQQVEELLKDAGYRVRMTRNDDSFMDKADRAKLANRKSPTIFVSIHCNSAENSQPEGIETFYTEEKGEESRQLAELIQSKLLEETGAKDREVKTADYVVIKNTKMPAVLAEVGFLSNETERALMQTEEYQQKLAKAIAAGITEYLQQEE